MWKVITVIVLTACVSFAQRPTTSFDGQALLQETVHFSEQRSLTIAELFRVALNNVGAPGGTVTVLGCQNSTTKRFNAEEKPLGQFLNELVDGDSGFRWELTDNGLNLLPTSGEPLLLQTKIREFNVRTDSSIEALNQLQRRPEITSAMQNLHLKGGLTILMYLSNSKQIDLHFKGGTLRQALNAIAGSKGREVWEYRETRCGEKNEVTITF